MKNAVKHLRWSLWMATCLLIAGCGRKEPVPTPPPQAAQQPQTTIQNDFRFSSFYDAPFQTQKKFDISGKEYEALPTGGTVLVRGLQFRTWREAGGEPEMVVEAPECIVDRIGGEVSSSGPVKVRTGDGLLAIEGTGFLWQQQGANSILDISNRVVTTIKMDILSGPNPTGTNAIRPITIRADKFTLDRAANLAMYTGNVRAEDDQMAMGCNSLSILRSASGVVTGMDVDGNVTLDFKATADRFTGRHAVYRTAAGGQLITLTGEPQWKGEQGEATAKTFVFDNLRRTFRAEEDAKMNLSRKSLQSFTETGLTLMPQPSPVTNIAGTNVGFITISSGLIVFQLPPTNGPIQSILAETNVVIVDTNGNSRATAQRATYSDTNRVLELTGNAEWQAEKQLARGGSLMFDAKNRSFAAKTNAYLKFPVKSLAGSMAAGDSLMKQLGEGTNHFVEASAGSYDFKNDVLTFRDNVMAAFLEDAAVRGTLTGGTVVTEMRSNAIRSVLAETDVQLRVLPMKDKQGKTVEQGLDSQRLQIQMRTNGHFERVTAEGGVTLTRKETPAGSSTPVHLKLTSGVLNAMFHAETNLMEKVIAERNVVLTRGDQVGAGDKAVYTEADDTAVLTGDPKWVFPGGWGTARDAITYDHKTGDFKLKGKPHLEYDIQPKLSDLKQPATPSTNKEPGR